MSPTFDQATELHTRTLDFKQLLDELNQDLFKAVTAARDTDDPFHRRSYVRAVFAYVEGTLTGTDRFFLDSAELGAAKALGWHLAADDLQSISDHVQIPRADGKKPRFLNVEPHVKLIVGIGDLLFGDLHMRFDGREWNDFRCAVQTRNRIVHPKRAADLRITDDETRQVDRARDWYRFGIQRLFIAAMAAYQELVDRRNAGRSVDMPRPPHQKAP